MRLWLCNVELAGRLVDVRVTTGRTTSDGAVVDPGRVDRVVPAGGGRPRPGDEVLDSGGGALLPGLHDHHVHLMSLAATSDSVDCSPEVAPDLADLAAALRADHHPDGWVRGIGHHDSGTGPLDRHVLDALVPDRPVRVQHRSGALWILNSEALRRVASCLDSSADVERDLAGVPTGRLWRYDDRLASALPVRMPDLATTGQRLRDLGITGVTDATPDLAPNAVDLLSAAVQDGRLPLDVTVLGAGATPPSPLRSGPAKLLIADHDLPTYDELLARVAGYHSAGRAVAVHCVTAESLILTLAVLEEVGVMAGDRIEHAAVVPSGLASELRRLGVRVVTQPDFLRTKGDRYLVEVDSVDVPYLYPYASLLDAGVPTACSSDAPFGELDPWQVIASARDRRTSSGQVLGPDEQVTTAVALGGYLSAAADPGGPARVVQVGSPTDLLLLRTGLVEALTAPDAGIVRGTLLGDDLRVH